MPKAIKPKIAIDSAIILGLGSKEPDTVELVRLLINDGYPLSVTDASFIEAGAAHLEIAEMRACFEAGLRSLKDTWNINLRNLNDLEATYAGNASRDLIELFPRIDEQSALVLTEPAAVGVSYLLTWNSSLLNLNTARNIEKLAAMLADHDLTAITPISPRTWLEYFKRDSH